MKKMCLGFLLITSLAGATPSESTLFEKGSGFKKPLYNWKREEPAPGKTVVTYTGMEGAEIIREQAVAEGEKIKSYDLDHKQLGEKGSLRTQDGKVILSYTKEGKTETETEDLTENLIVGLTTVDYLKVHWAELLKGDTVSVRYAALDRKETVGFKFFKIEEKTLEGEEVVIIKMKPSSFIIAALVDPLIFTFRKKDTRLLYLEGRTVPKQRIEGKWKDLDVEVKYRYPSQG